MWLLDANVPVALRSVLAGFSIYVETTESRGWKLLRNGELIESAYNAGFRVIVTQDEDFKQLAGKYIARFPDLAFVRLRLPQAHWKAYRESFITAWNQSPLEPVSGQLVEWPKSVN